VTSVVAWKLAKIAAGAVLGFLLFQQCRKPWGPLGRRIAKAMNIGHAKLTKWALSLATIGPRARMLDIGCGGGRTIQTLAGMVPEGHVDGVDYAPASVAIARETNADLIAAGRVAVQHASVSRLPFADATFDFITAVETHYYWPDLSHDLREVRRVLAPGGQFLLVAETYKGRPMDWLYRPVMRLMLRATYLSLDEHRVALTEAGFASVEVHTHPSGWMCALGRKPAA
jgi:ubiquinone/menaquinone biosynthesis C-methylase UbiE